jgi:hypothetical protein
MSRILRRWTATQGDCQRFARLDADQFVIGGNSRENPQTESARTCTLEELLAGKYWDLVREYFGLFVLDEMRFLARVEITSAQRKPQCRCQLFGEDERCDPSTIEKVGYFVLEPRESGDDEYTVRYRCPVCGRRWEIGVNCGYHYTLFLWKLRQESP